MRVMEAGTVALGMVCGLEWVDIGQKKPPDVPGASVDVGNTIPNKSNTHASSGAWSPVHARARRADRVAR